MKSTQKAHLVTTLQNLAPPRLADDWDNVGLIVEGPPEAKQEVGRVLLTVDLTPGVAQEALDHAIDFVVAYHPPIFQGLKRVTCATPHGRMLTRLIAAGVAVYSPHTALDAACGGMTDWLLGCLDAVGGVDNVAPIKPCLGAANTPGHENAGYGRTATLKQSAPVSAVLAAIKDHLQQPTLRVACTDTQAPIKRVAVCPGAGGSIFEKLRGVDLLLTGEMRHHDVLGRVAAGSCVVLSEHSHTERGFLAVVAERLRQAHSGLWVMQSRVDRDPLQWL